MFVHNSKSFPEIIRGNFITRLTLSSSYTSGRNHQIYSGSSVLVVLSGIQSRLQLQPRHGRRSQNIHL